MNTCVISDIHGCYEEFMAMLDKIGFSPADRLILVGDYVDRGKDSFRMLKWLEQKPENVYAVLGNHDEGFARSVELMAGLDRKLGLRSGLDSPQEGLALYESLRYYMKKKGLPGGYFDLYGTIRILLERKGATLRDLYQWMEMFRNMPLCHELKVRERICVVVHGGYAENPKDVAGAGYSVTMMRKRTACSTILTAGALTGGRIYGGVWPVSGWRTRREIENSWKVGFQAGIRQAMENRRLKGKKEASE